MRALAAGAILAAIVFFPSLARARDGGVEAELVVVFQKGIAAARAEQVLQQLGGAFRSGSDSSHGKGYFYAHGPHYLVRLPESDLPRFAVAAKKRAEIFETFRADWSVQKD